MKNTNKLKIKTQKAIDQHKLWKRSQDCFKEDYRRPAAGAQGGVGQGVFILSGQCSLECVSQHRSKNQQHSRYGTEQNIMEPARSVADAFDSQPATGSNTLNKAFRQIQGTTEQAGGDRIHLLSGLQEDGL